MEYTYVYIYIRWNICIYLIYYYILNITYNNIISKIIIYYTYLLKNSAKNLNNRLF